MQLDASSNDRVSLLLWLSLSPSHFWKHGLWCGCLKWLISDMEVCRSTMAEGVESKAVCALLPE